MRNFILVAALLVSAGASATHTCDVASTFGHTQAHVRTFLYNPDHERNYLMTGHFHFMSDGTPRLMWLREAGEPRPVAGTDESDVWSPTSWAYTPAAGTSCVLTLCWDELFGGYCAQGHVTDGDWLANPSVALEGWMNVEVNGVPLTFTGSLQRH